MSRKQEATAGASTTTQLTMTRLPMSPAQSKSAPPSSKTGPKSRPNKSKGEPTVVKPKEKSKKSSRKMTAKQETSRMKDGKRETSREKTGKREPSSKKTDKQATSRKKADEQETSSRKAATRRKANEGQKSEKAESTADKKRIASTSFDESPSTYGTDCETSSLSFSSFRHGSGRGESLTEPSRPATLSTARPSDEMTARRAMTNKLLDIRQRRHGASVQRWFPQIDNIISRRRDPVLSDQDKKCFTETVWSVVKMEKAAYDSHSGAELKMCCIRRWIEQRRAKKFQEEDAKAYERLRNERLKNQTRVIQTRKGRSGLLI